ncbi:MAG: sigma-E factor regulatory protein RseB domain-containing protein, partial [Pseudomonadota bacterium]
MADCPDLDPDVLSLLTSMSNSAARGDYSGVVTLQRGSEMQVMGLSHRVVDGAATEVMTRLTGQDARVVRAGHPTNCTHPGHNLLLAANSDEAGICGLAASYRFRLDSGERIAGRDAVRLRIDPLDMYRYGYVFELDKETALMLKSTTYSEDQRVIEQYQFASLRMDDTPVPDARIEHLAGHPYPTKAGPLAQKQPRSDRGVRRDAQYGRLEPA